MRQRLVLNKQKDGRDKICVYLAISTHKTTDSSVNCNLSLSVTTAQPTLCCTAAWAACWTPYRFQVPVKLLVLVTYAHKMAQGFSAAKAKVVFEGDCGFWDFRDQWDPGRYRWEGKGCVSLPMLLDGFPCNSYLPFCFLPQAWVALCCKQTLTLWAQWRCHKPGMQN